MTTKISTYVPRTHQMKLYGVDDDTLDQLLREKYNASEKIVEESVRLFREWYAKQPHLPDIHFDDGYIKRFLLIRKMSLEDVKIKIDNLLTAMSSFPDIFGNRDPLGPKIQNAMKYGYYATVPKMTKEKYRLCIFKFNPDMLDDFDPIFGSIILFMFSDIRISQDANLGDVYIWDCSSIHWPSYIKKANPVFLKKTFFLTENCYGAGIKGIHLLNLPSYAEFLVTAIKTVMKKKVADRIFVHSSVESLQNHLSKDVLPLDYGGTFPMHLKDMSDNLYTAMKSPEWREWFLATANIKVDEKKRPNNSKLMDDVLGIHGTFRKLDID